jgi:glucose-1-phosphate cytidylyltransferase
MKVAILAGGAGSRLAEETEVKPKPMVEIGGKPILWHIMKRYSCFGYSKFFIALGYKGEVIKRYIIDYCSLQADLTVRLADGTLARHADTDDDWEVGLIDTGLQTGTGGRVKRLQTRRSC